MSKSPFSVFVLTALTALASSASVAADAPSLSQQGVDRGSVVARLAQPFGATVLYTQGGPLVTTVVAQDFLDVPQRSAQVADDFVITEPSGWTVTSIVVDQSRSAVIDIRELRYRFEIFANVDGKPAPQAQCSGSGLVPEFDNTQTVVTIALPSACYLAPGTWWVSATPAIAFDGAYQTFQVINENPAQIGFAPHWQNPNGGWGGNCRSWTALVQCPDLFNVILTPTESMGFSILGHTGGEPGSISLTVGLAPANGNPAQCGTATRLSTTAGDSINFCYTVTNNTSVALKWQSLMDTVVGDLLVDRSQTIAAGGSYQYNRTITASVSQSPTSTWTASDRLPGYAASTVPYAFVPIHTSGTVLTLGDDVGVLQTMPFSFTYYGQTSNLLCVNNNGIIFFARAVGCNTYGFNFTLPTASISQSASFFAPFWDDFYAGGNVYTQTVGTAPNRRYVVEYYQRGLFDQSLPPTYHSGAGYTLQLILNEADGSIDFNYDNVANGGLTTGNFGAQATVGLQNNRLLADLYSFNAAVLTDHQNIHWTEATIARHASSATVTLDVGAPIISVLPNPLTASAEAGTATTVPLYIANVGNRDLLWQQTPPAANSHFPPIEAWTLPFHAAAETRTGRDPTPQSGAIAKSTPATVLAAVPAYGIAYYDQPSGPMIVSLDAEDGASLTPVAPASRHFFAGAFAGNDFSRQFMVDSPASDLYAVSSSTGVQTLIGNTGVPARETVSGIRWDSSTDTTYLMTTECGVDYRSTLYTLNLETGATSLIGTAANRCIIDIAITPLGLMYGVDVLSDTLVAINKTTGAAASRGSLGFNANYAQGMDFDASTGILYLAGYSGHASAMYTLDLISGHASLISPLGPNVQLDAFAIARPVPACLRPVGVPWLSHGLLSGVVVPADSVVDPVTLNASALATGVYNTTICVSSNDLLRPLTSVPVTFTVVPAVLDRFMKSGFDAVP